jgi:hypothetical protein
MMSDTMRIRKMYAFTKLYDEIESKLATYILGKYLRVMGIPTRVDSHVTAGSSTYVVHSCAQILEAIYLTREQGFGAHAWTV